MTAQVSWSVFFIILIVFVLLDKGITLANLIQVKKNFPKVDFVNIEKNPMMKFFYQKAGLTGGTILGIISTLIITALAYFFASNFLGPSIPLYALFIIYGFTVFNNLYFLLKYSGVIP